MSSLHLPSNKYTYNACTVDHHLYLAYDRCPKDHTMYRVQFDFFVFALSQLLACIERHNLVKSKFSDCIDHDTFVVFFACLERHNLIKPKSMQTALMHMVP